MLSRQSVRAAHGAAKHAAATTPKAEQITKLPSGLTVASVDNFGPVSQLVLAFRAGSRYETPAQGGLVHHIRDFVGRDAEDYHGMQLIWSANQHGGRVNAFATRDLFGVALSLPRDATNLGLSVLGHMAARPAFKPWEVEDVIPNLEIDNANKDPYQVVFEDIHRAAYRNGSLANSVYAAKFQIGKFKYGEMVDFANKHFLSGNAVLYGANIDHETLKGYGSTHLDICQGGAVAPIKSPYKGGDWRRQAKSEWAHVLLAGEGAAGSDAKALATQAVLLTALGRSSNVPHDASVGAGLLSKSVSGSAAASAFQAVHADNSLAGIYIVAPVNHIEKAVRNAAQTIKSLTLSNLEAAKRRTALDLLRASVHSAPQSLERTAQIFNNIDDRAILKAVEQVTASDVQSAAKRIAAKFSVASYGAVNNVPYADTL